MKLPNYSYARYGASFLLGLTLVFGFSPFNFWLAGFIVPALLYCLVNGQSRKKAFIFGFCFGLGEFGFGVSWVYVSLAHYGNGIIMAGVITLGFVMLLSLFPALQMALLQQSYCKKQSHAVRLLLIYPALWLISELVRSSLFTGFPWLLLGYTQTFTPFAGYAKLGSVFLVSWITALIAGLLLLLCFKCKSEKNRIQFFYRKGVFLVILIILFAAGALLRQHQFTKSTGAPISVALIQGNISEEEKWQPHSLNKIITTYINLTLPNLNHALIIWPENAIPMFQDEVPKIIANLDAGTKAYHSAIVFGIPIENADQSIYFNGALVAGENSRGMYLKQHLVPLGEYLPDQAILSPIFSAFQIPMSDFSKGDSKQGPVIIHGLPVRLFICYESAYPFLFRQARDAAYIITLTDDAWFGHSLGSYQHEEIEVMRAIETGRPILRATNTGITSIIDQNGRIISRAPMYQSAVLTGTINAVSGQTPWLKV